MIPLTNKILAGALALQVGLAGLTWMSADAPPIPARPLLELDIDAVESLTITGRTTPDADAEPVQLSRSGEGWVIDSLFGYPATDANVAKALAPLADLTVRGPIATNDYNHVALEVATQQYTRKVELNTDQGTDTVYLGAASGRGLNVRLDGEVDVYSVRGNTAWSIPDQANRFFDRDVFRIPADEVGELVIHRPGESPIELVRSGAQWTSPGLPDGMQLDPTQTDTFVASVLTLRMLEPAAATETAAHGLESGIEITWTGVDGVSGEGSRLRIGSTLPDEDQQFYVRWDAQPFVLAVRRGTLVTALETPFESLWVPMAPPTAPSP